MVGVHWDYQERRRLDQWNRNEFDRRWADQKTQTCWVVLQSTGMLPRDCLKE
jgi:hypothetical protein